MIDERIIKFIEKHHVLTLATSINNQPWCSNCFYVFDNELNAFIYTTSDDTRHGQEAIKNENVSASIVLETGIVGKIRGLQIQGKMKKPLGESYKFAKSRYLKKFPYARLMETNIWILEPNFMKYTDNRLGFGTKLIWEK